MNFKESQAIYLQIADYVCEQILSGRWKPGNRALSVRELGVALEVNPNTVLRAYDFLQNMDIISNKRGVGYFISDQAESKIMEFRKERFFHEELPPIFKNMQLLRIELKEVEERYNKFKNHNSEQL